MRCFVLQIRSRDERTPMKRAPPFETSGRGLGLAFRDESSSTLNPLWRVASWARSRALVRAAPRRDELLRQRAKNGSLPSADASLLDQAMRSKPAAFVQPQAALDVFTERHVDGFIAVGSTLAGAPLPEISRQLPRLAALQPHE